MVIATVAVMLHLSPTACSDFQPRVLHPWLCVGNSDTPVSSKFTTLALSILCLSNQPRELQAKVGNALLATLDCPGFLQEFPHTIEGIPVVHVVFGLHGKTPILHFAAESIAAHA